MSKIKLKIVDLDEFNSDDFKYEINCSSSLLKN